MSEQHPLNFFSMFPWWFYLIMAASIAATIIKQQIKKSGGSHNNNVETRFVLKKSAFKQPVQSTSVLTYPIGPLPYQHKNFFMTPPERNFYRMLCGILKDQKIILFCQVRLADIVNTPENAKMFVQYVAKKSVDFLICSNDTTFNPLLVIELDDLSHEQSKRIERDDFVERALLAARIPFLRVPMQTSYDIPALTEKVKKHISS